MATSLHRADDGVFVLDLGDGDIRFNADTVSELDEHLSSIETAVASRNGVADNADVPAALVTVSSSNIWHNGLDLDWLAGRDDLWEFVGTVQALFAKLMRLNLATVAAIGGHAFAGGAMFALAHDYRVMRTDRGYFCLPEVDLSMTFGDGFASLVRAKVPTGAVARLAVLGERLSARDALTLGVIDQTAPDADATRRDAAALATGLSSKAGGTIAAIRDEYFGAAIDALSAARPNGSSR